MIKNKIEVQTKDSWKVKEFTKSKKFDCNLYLTKEIFEKISLGHKPSEMEDRWFMYCDEFSINFYRSWTGIPIYKAYYEVQENYVKIFALEINTNPDEYNPTSINDSIQDFIDMTGAKEHNENF